MDEAISRPRSWLPLVVLVAICLGAAAVGASLTSRSVGEWYPSLRKPAWTPPSGVFAPVWTVLYLMMAVACARIWRLRRRSGARAALLAFAVQLALNVAWSGLFFGLRNPLLGAIEIALLWLMIAVTAVEFARLDAVAAWLLVPYAAWVAFAAALNLAIVRLN